MWTVTMKNDGHAVIISGFGKWNEQPCITKGLGSTYMLSQFHFHWSQGPNDGEHTVDGQHNAAELHMVHVKEGLSLTDALARALAIPDGVAVLGVLFQITYDGRTLATAKRTKPSEEKSEDASFKIDNFVPNALLPSGLEVFFRYYGSLTTPGYNEAVVWTVFAAPRSISGEQIQLFRAVCAQDGNPISSNVRPVQTFNKKAQKHTYEKFMLCLKHLYLSN
ncbi:hypothetical protein niasHT_009778 [Heterodera trifolii]|uniref:carbonic anhydrase n=1 Tax=Heterodera trifolii TaxID=157864 RepID=A0ABD2MDT7_9BILA